MVPSIVVNNMSQREEGVEVVQGDFDRVPPAGQRVYPNSGNESDPDTAEEDDDDDVRHYRKFASPAYKAR